MSRRSPSVAPVQTRERPTPFRERFRREVLATIAEAAEDVFAEQGLRDAHVGEIARRAGVAVGTLYNYYEDRDALLAALLKERQDAFLATLEAALATPGPFRVQLHTFVTAYMAFFTKHRRYFKILLEGELMHLQAALPRAASVQLGCYQLLMQRIEALGDGGVKTGVLRPAGAGLYAWLILGMLRSLAMRDIRNYKAYEPTDGEELVSVFLRGAEV